MLHATRAAPFTVYARACVARICERADGYFDEDETLYKKGGRKRVSKACPETTENVEEVKVDTPLEKAQALMKDACLQNVFFCLRAFAPCPCMALSGYPEGVS